MHRFTNLLLKAYLIASSCCAITSAAFTSVSLTGSLTGATLEHQVNLNDPNANGQDTITIRYTVPQTSWVAVGVNPTGTGMVNGQVVIGKPDDNNSVRKYGITAKSPNAINELPNQTLINPSLQQSGGNTVLTFTKLLEEDGEYAIEAGASNTFIAAFGFANNFGFHQGYGVQEVTLDAGTIATPTAPTGTSPTPDAPVAPAPTNAPVDPPTNPPVDPPTTPPADDGFIQVPLSGNIKEATFGYVLNRNDARADGEDTITIKFTCPGNVWAGVGVSQFGGMVPSRSVIGFPGSGNAPMRYKMEAQVEEGVTPLPDDQQTLIDPQISFANDRTTLLYTLPLVNSGGTDNDGGNDDGTDNVGPGDDDNDNPGDDDNDNPGDDDENNNNRRLNDVFQIHADGSTNTNFIGACGTLAGPSFHQYNGAFGVTVKDTADAPTTAAPFTAPTSPPGVEVLKLTEELQGSTLSYKFTPDDPSTGGKDSITVTFTAPVTAWVGVGVSESGGMVGSDAVIGIPATGEVKKYKLNSQAGDLSGVNVLAAEKQTLVNTAITQANGMTTLTYTKILVEDGEVPINRVGENNFIAAQGSSNTLGYHSAKGAFSLSGKVIKRDDSLWALHGLLAFIAWGLLCPLAILAGLYRKIIPGEGRWYVIHRTLQGLTIVLTIAAVAVAIVALNKETPASSSANHFSTDFVGGHRLIGLVVLILAIVQGAGGIMRPHLPPKPEETTDFNFEDPNAPSPPPAEKSGARKVWEVFHRLLGICLLALTWYQIYLGIFWYYEIFKNGESASGLTVYYAVIGVFGGAILSGIATRLMG